MADSNLRTVGGIPSRSDVIPTIIFLCLYSFLTPFILVRLFSPKTRNVLQLPISAAIVERILTLVVRLLQATGKWAPRNALLLEYQQVTLGWGWISLGHSMVSFWRSLVVNATTYHGATEEETSFRKRWSRVTYVLDAGFWVAQLLGLGSGVAWRRAFASSQPDVTVHRALTCSSTLLAAFLVFGTLYGIHHTHRHNMTGQRMGASQCWWLTGVYTLLLIVPIFRLIVPVAGNLPSSLFYTFHISPEFIAAAVLIGTNTRIKFATGAWGDYRFSWWFGWQSRSSRAVQEDAVRLFQDVETGFEKQPAQRRFRYPTEPSRVHRPSVSIEGWLPHKTPKGHQLLDSLRTDVSQHDRPPPALIREKRSSALSYNCLANNAFEEDSRDLT